MISGAFRCSRQADKVCAGDGVPLEPKMGNGTHGGADLVSFSCCSFLSLSLSLSLCLYGFFVFYSEFLIDECMRFKIYCSEASSRHQ